MYNPSSVAFAFITVQGRSYCKQYLIFRQISLQVQRRYLYLETIFAGEDIRKQLPAEVKTFDALTAAWTEVTFK